MDRGRLLLIRHGESTWNATGRWQGWGDPPLSERGREQAQSLAATLASGRVSRIVSSDLQRARETADILGTALGIAREVDRRLRERDLGRWSGLTENEIRAAYAEELAYFRTRAHDARPGGGESRVRFVARVGPALVALGAAARAADVAVVTHLGVIRLLRPDLRPDHTEVVAIDPSEIPPQLE